MKEREKFKEYIPIYKKRAVKGEVSAMTQLFWAGRRVGDEDAMSQAISLLENHTSLAAELCLIAVVRQTRKLTPRESSFYDSYFAIKNLRSPGVSDMTYSLTTNRRAQRVRLVKEKAADGVGDAIWVINQLEAEGLDTSSY